MYTTPMKMLTEARSIGSPWTGGTDRCEHLIWVLRLELGLLEEQHALSTAAPGLHPTDPDRIKLFSLHLLI